MGKKMLIDAAHPEETRVVVVAGNRVDEFDFESESRKQLRGNIYLAKVTRVEPSLQAAFVEYGGNRHGFLAFSEIHPDYYQIPVADREALIRQQADEARQAAAEEDAEDEAPRKRRGAKAAKQKKAEETAEAVADDNEAEDETGPEEGLSDSEEDYVEEDTAEYGDEEDAVIELEEADTNGNDDTETVLSDETVESMGDEDALEEAEPRKKRFNYRSYKIQEVIKRRQIILVQVVKEERGNKGAALTTYLSLAGRYCVLMPNTARGGGISRKITQATDRKKLKSIAESLDVPEGMGLIIRTAGAKRTKAEIKRDYEYLLRMWESVRELTLRSSAPTLVYEEGSLIKRSIRDLYDKDIDTIQIEGDEGYREAKNFMRMLMPSHAKNVQPYKDRQPLFQRFQVDQQLDSMLDPVVTLKSGGYVVINPTEALVSIDVNSGRSTKERNIEQTALRTNLEAAEEISRQMRLRDLAGLIVIDFIDMDENRNNRAVERKLKECLKHDRARIQVGRISHFGLMEMSRQRMRSGVLESSTVTCPHCKGTGLIRSVESMALHVLRAVEAEAIKAKAEAFTVRVPTEAAIYILNQKRATLLDIEDRYNVSIYVEGDATLSGSEHDVQVAEPRKRTRTRPAMGAINIESTYADEPGEDAAAEAEEDQSADDENEQAAREDDEDSGRRNGRRRRRRRKPRDDASASPAEEASAPSGDEESDDQKADADSDAESSDEEGNGEDDDQPRKRRRRGRRGGRRNRRRSEEQGDTEQQDGESSGDAVASDDKDAGDDNGDDDNGDDDSADNDVDNDNDGGDGEEEEILLSYSRDEVHTSEKETDEDENDLTPEDFQDEIETEDEVPVDVFMEGEETVEEHSDMEEEKAADKAASSDEEQEPEKDPVAADAGTGDESGDTDEPDRPARRGWWQRR
ncbi:Rne/Rng family ribonuclease [Parvibaculum sp.]|uniref:Rne/Rng family ribonuclease n=1 Tax=Parvibaculum sp. TaxID=2024848 RepID=UPI000C9177E6|nr:Rne/Rng family ribonuclease [Parvibaculum sp.]MAB13174.1 ribonuclease E/G [Parvibaculum sp.]